MIILIHVDDCVIISKDDKKISETMVELRKNYTITDEGNMEEYLGIQLKHTGNSISVSRPLFIERIIDEILGMKNSKPVNYSVLSSVILIKDEQELERVENRIIDQS